jgi:hypothetical protein
MSQSSHSSARPSGFASILWALLSVALFALVATVWVSRTGSVDIVSEERAQKRLQLREKVDHEDSQRLNAVAWVDKAKGVVQLPIGRAKEVGLEGVRARKPAPSAVALDPVLPMPPAFDPRSSEPQPPALPSSPQGADTIRFTTSAPDASVVPAANLKSDSSVPATAPDASQNKAPEAPNAQ